MDGKKTKMGLYKFFKRFPDERAAREHLEFHRWNGKPACPACNQTDRVQKRKVEGYYRCLACKSDFTVRTGTIYERSHLPLDKWLLMMYLLTPQIQRMVFSNQLPFFAQLAMHLSVTRKSAVLIYRKLRDGCGTLGTIPPTGIYEIDEVVKKAVKMQRKQKSQP